jgi:hypothetical protein
MSTKEFKRLPASVLPVNYALELTPNLTEFVFQGHVTIDVNVKKNYVYKLQKIE